MKFHRFVFLRAFPVVALALLSLPSILRGQTASARPRVTQAVDSQKLVVLRGNVHPLARAEFDRGAAPDSLPLNRMLLVLQRSPEQEAALGKFLEEQQTKSSVNYHKWLAPEEFGQQFGPADADVQAVTGWLQSQGFQGVRAAAGKTVIEFSGTAAQLRGAFHTELHKFNVNGEERWANASDPQIPAALAPVVAGFASLHNFPRRPMSHRVGLTPRTREAAGSQPLLTTTTGCGPGGTSHCYDVAPGDFAKIYNVPTLVNGAAAGTGQTIAVVGRTNINIQDARDFRKLFFPTLTANDPQIILNGPDPGIISQGEETEADLDVEWSGAAAPAATISFVVSEDTLVAQGTDLSALYIIENNIASVLTESFGACEFGLTNAGNQFFSNLWEQAASQGITVLISAGDNGPAGCDDPNSQTSAKNGLAVSGIASTPFNIAVGGTDFDDAGIQQPNFWNPPAGNDPVTHASAKSYIPEVPLNDSCAAAGLLTGCTTVNSSGADLFAASGGPSNCSTLNLADTACVSGYARPSWQTGPWTFSSDGRRDLPDISLFAGDGKSDSAFIVCQADQVPAGRPASCSATGSFSYTAVGGTSASVQAFAGIMALVNQQTGQHQGNANFVLYKLAALPNLSCDSSLPGTITNPVCTFYDTTKNTISVACAGASPNCSKTTTGGFGIMVDNPAIPTPKAAWTTTTGYDMATGLGTVNVANLLTNWSSASFTPSNTTLTLNGGITLVKITHGQSVNVSATVTPSSPTPTGDVSLISDQASGALGIDFQPLPSGSGTVAWTTNLLPGGSYAVHAHYSGDVNYGSKDSNPAINVQVTAEPSKTTLSFVTFDATGLIATCHTAPISVVYGSPYILRVDVTSASGTACSNSPASPFPTGTITLTDNGSALPDFASASSGLLPNQAVLNSLGFLEDQPIQLPASTTAHSLVATYSGDTSFSGPTSSPAVAVTITKAATTSAVAASPSTLISGSNVTLTATITTQSNGAAPGGTVQFFNGATAIPGTVTYTPVDGSATGAAKLAAKLSTTLSALTPPMPAVRRFPPAPNAPLSYFVSAIVLLLAYLLRAALPRKRGYAFAGFLLFALLLAGIAGCGSSGNGGGGGGGGSKSLSITATYSGDANYSASTSPAAIVTVQ